MAKTLPIWLLPSLHPRNMLRPLLPLSWLTTSIQVCCTDTSTGLYILRYSIIRCGSLICKTNRCRMSISACINRTRKLTYWIYFCSLCNAERESFNWQRSPLLAHRPSFTLRPRYPACYNRQPTDCQGSSHLPCSP